MERLAMKGQWQWQEEGTSWKGVGIYHVTLTVPSREPLLGKLVIPNNDPVQARVERTELGAALLDCLRSVPTFHPEIQILQYSLMPDHLHSIWYVRRPMDESIRYAVQGFWRAVKKMGRAYSFLNTGLAGRAMDERAMGERTMDEREGMKTGLAGRAMDERGMDERTMDERAGMKTGLAGRGMDERTMDEREGMVNEKGSLSSIAPADSRGNPLRQLLGGDVYSGLAPVFTEVPFIRPLSRRGQLKTMIRYVRLNPQRLATKRLMPGFFRVQEGIEIAGRTYSGVGNVSLLHAERYAPVHVRHELVDAAAQGNVEPLREYMNGCVVAARRGTVLVSPFISPKEKEVKAVLLSEKHPIIILTDNGFRDFYKPSDDIFDAVADGRVLVLSPWAYEAKKRHISRADCMALNAMAEQIAAM